METLTQNTKKMKNLKNNSYDEMIKNTKICKGLKVIGESFQGALIFEKAKFEFAKFDIQIVRIQWTKTQGAWAIRVNNFYSTKKHFCQLPIDKLKDCFKAIEILKNEGSFHHWTGIVVQPGTFIK